MNLWIRVRHIGPLAAITTVALAAAVAVGRTAIPLPSSTDGLLQGIPLAYVLPLAPVSVLMLGLTHGPRAHEDTAVRPLVGYDTALIAVLCAVTLAIGGGTALLGIQPLGPAVARNIVGYAGMALIGLRTLGPHASMAVPSALLLASALVGAPGTWWAWPLGGPAVPETWVLALTMLAIGLTAFVTSPTRR
ncbi:hypothetical protein [Streptomyces sp. NPDC059009]|uniref:hypothetical protein n=1 Tax=Streptomyces sp. NPDC059009 TaxID=3346694 RepID=UPI00369478EA